GLAASLRTQVDQFGRRAHVKTRLVLDEDALAPLDDDAQLVVYRVVQEGLSNVARHANASEVVVSVAREGDDTVVRIDDDGGGFDTSRSSNGLGLLGMRERATLTGGRVAVRSVPGEGTSIELRLGDRTCVC